MREQPSSTTRKIILVIKVHCPKTPKCPFDRQEKLSVLNVACNGLMPSKTYITTEVGDSMIWRKSIAPLLVVSAEPQWIFVEPVIQTTCHRARMLYKPVPSRGQTAPPSSLQSVTTLAVAPPSSLQSATTLAVSRITSHKDGKLFRWAHLQCRESSLP